MCLIYVTEFGILTTTPCEKYLLEQEDKPHYGFDGSLHHPKVGVKTNDKYFVEYIQYDMDPSTEPIVNKSKIDCTSYKLINFSLKHLFASTIHHFLTCPDYSHHCLLFQQPS